MQTQHKPQPTIEDFHYTNHDTGAAAIAAKLISEGKTVSFDKWEMLDVKTFQAILKTTERTFVETVYIGIVEIEEGLCLRISPSQDLEAVNSHSLIPTWNPAEQVKDPVFIAAEIVAYMYSQRHQSRCNFFINK